MPQNLCNNPNDKPRYNPAIHHRRSIRLNGYDYSQDGLYFITICTHHREYLFGEIVNKKMMLNDRGKVAGEYWLKIPEHFPNAVLHEYVIMPDHVHGIIELVNLPTANVQNAAGIQHFERLPPDFESLP